MCRQHRPDNDIVPCSRALWLRAPIPREHPMPRQHLPADSNLPCPRPRIVRGQQNLERGGNGRRGSTPATSHSRLDGGSGRRGSTPATSHSRLLGGSGRRGSTPATSHSHLHLHLSRRGRTLRVGCPDPEAPHPPHRGRTPRVGGPDPRDQHPTICVRLHWLHSSVHLPAQLGRGRPEQRAPPPRPKTDLVTWERLASIPGARDSRRCDVP